MKTAIVFTAGVVVGTVFFAKTEKDSLRARTGRKIGRYFASKVSAKLLDLMHEADERDAVYDQYRETYRAAR